MYSANWFAVCFIWLTGVVATPPDLQREVQGRVSEAETLDSRFTCGRNALYALAGITGSQVSLSELADALSERPGPRGVSLLDLQVAGERIGFPCTVRRLSFEDLVGTSLPVIAHFTTSHVTAAGSGHFVVVVKIMKERMLYLDPTTTNYGAWTIDSFKRQWTGYILQPTFLFQRDANASQKVLGLSALLISGIAAFIVFQKTGQKQRADSYSGHDITASDNNSLPRPLANSGLRGS